MSKPKIAICDLLMCWPPDAGAFVDVVNIASRLAQYAHVKLILPKIQTFFKRRTVVDRVLGRYSRFFMRGVVEGTFPFEVQHIDFTGLDFRHPNIGREYAKVLKAFGPDKTFITNGWHLKAHFASALAAWKPVLRIYAHEFLCTKAGGWFFRRGKICERNHLEGGLHDYLGCLLCSLGFYATYPAVRWVQEYVQARAWTPSYSRIVKEGLSSASAIIVYNEWTAARVRLYNPQVTIIPSGVDCTRFSSARTEKTTDGVAVIVPGRVTEKHKGRDFLAEVVEVMGRKRPQMVFRITGALRGLQGSNVVGAGWLGPEALPELYRSSQVAFIPSLWPEPQGIVALEAAASGLPVVASAVGGLQEMVLDGQTGYLVPPGDVASTVEVLCRLNDDPALRRRLGEAGRRRCAEEFDWDSIFDRYYRPLFLDAISR